MKFYVVSWGDGPQGGYQYWSFETLEAARTLVREDLGITDDSRKHYDLEDDPTRGVFGVEGWDLSSGENFGGVDIYQI